MNKNKNMKCIFIYAFVFTIIAVVVSSDSQLKRWHYADDTSRQTCILVEFIARLNITYPTEDGKISRTIYTIPVNKSLVISGSCGDGESDQNITIEWTEKNLLNTMDLLFKFYPETHLYSLNAITFEINAAIFPNGSAHMSKYLYVGDEFWAPEGWSYRCKKWQIIELSSENRRYIMGTVVLTNIQFEASLTGNIEQFSKPVECRVDDLTTKIVFISIAAVVVTFISIGVYIYFHRLRF